MRRWQGRLVGQSPAKRINDTSPELLYHYTSQTGLLGIVKTRQLWASKIQYLNDTTEFLHGLDQVTRVLRKYECEFLDLILQRYVKSTREAIERMSGLNIFVASFSASPDLLSQWRASTKNETGYALGFEINRLANLGGKHDFSLEACVYEPSMQRRKAEEFVDHQLRYFQTLRDRITSGDEDSISKWMERLTGEFCQGVSILAALFKDQAFREEKRMAALFEAQKCVR